MFLREFHRCRLLCVGSQCRFGQVCGDRARVGCLVLLSRVVVGSHQYGLLKGLRLNGGRTLSHNLFRHSIAIDAATGCNGPNGLNTVDQRGNERPAVAGSDCDIGAVEKQ